MGKLFVGFGSCLLVMRVGGGANDGGLEREEERKEDEVPMK